MLQAGCNAMSKKAVSIGGRCRAAALALAVLASAMPVHAEIVGKAQVIDAQTLAVGGRVVRLFGITAPGADETCGTGARAWPCGREARSATINQLYPHWVTCVEREHEAADGAVAAVCYLAGVGQKEVNAWLVAAGWARADVAVAPEYAAAEAAARAAGRGMWRRAPAAPR